MINEDTLAVVTKVAAFLAGIFIVIPGAVWLLIKYIQFLAWAGNL